jgi:hypothetical protein
MNNYEIGILFAKLVAAPQRYPLNIAYYKLVTQTDTDSMAAYNNEKNHVQ